ncbi:DUF1775 domain-containing protein [Nocardioides glacieisoli]|uniref:DUF1775 domain-containing protein n=1 Tax=Nocardioides glacieisoli TaxID=1168730 RepID=A0A4Q2RN95_9ACTN|nr:DUF1775 domain-containing protein [Nocardioides glacieisoli]RYB89876.1 DUF1775 domain-containing protein [Nocardioides glacieisoli]
MPHTSSAAMAAVPAALAVLVVGVAAPASAHVTLDASTTGAGARSVLTLEVPHGCAGSATTEVAVRVPAGVSDVGASDTDRWSAAVTDEGVSFRTDHPLPDGMREQVVFSVRLPDRVGAELVFPVVQRCEVGDSAWTEVGEDDAARDDLEMPAPVVVVTATDGSSADPAISSGAMSYGAAGILALACLGSGALLLLRRRRA